MSDDTTKVCGACGLEQPQDKYSKKQWQAKKQRRCKHCVAVEKPINLETLESAENRHNGSTDPVARRLMGKYVKLKQQHTDTELFNNGYTFYAGDCEICGHVLPLNVDNEVMINVCCGKMICMGCDLADFNSEREGDTCQFCRGKPTGDQQALACLKKRVDCQDPDACCSLGKILKKGNLTRQKNLPKAIQLFKRAVEIGSGNNDSHWQLGKTYYEGNEILLPNLKLASYHVERAAMSGHPSARHQLGCAAYKAGRCDKAAKHWIISSRIGWKESLTNLKDMVAIGHATSDQYKEASEGYEKIVDEMETPQRQHARITIGCNSSAYHWK